MDTDNKEASNSDTASGKSTRTLDPAVSVGYPAAAPVSSVQGSTVQPSIHRSLRGSQDRRKRQSMAFQTVLSRSQLSLLSGDGSQVSLSANEPLKESDESVGSDLEGRGPGDDDDQQDAADTTADSTALLGDMDSDIGDTSGLLQNAFSDYQRAIDNLDIRDESDRSSRGSPIKSRLRRPSKHSDTISLAETDELLSSALRPTHTLKVNALSESALNHINVYQFPGFLCATEGKPAPAAVNSPIPVDQYPGTVRCYSPSVPSEDVRRKRTSLYFN